MKQYLKKIYWRDLMKLIIHKTNIKKNIIKYIILTLIILSIFECFETLNAYTIEEVNSFCDSLSDYYKGPRELLPAIIRVESDYIQNSISSKNAYGLMQVTYNAFLDYKNINPSGIVKSFEEVKTNWRANCRVGSWYFYRVCYKQKGNYKDAITSYFWGINHASHTETYYNKVKKEELKNVSEKN